MRNQRGYFFFTVLIVVGLACARTDVPADFTGVTPIGFVTPFGGVDSVLGQTATDLPTGPLLLTTPPVPGLPAATLRPTQDIARSPTPDATRASILSRQSEETYTVQAGDSLGKIAERYGVTAAEIAAANGMAVTDTLYAGQTLLIPVPNAGNYGPDYKLVPDSEFVYGPGTVGFDLDGFVRRQGGYLAAYTEEVPGYLIDNVVDSAVLTGSEIVRLIAQRYSISPKLLLAVLEYRSGWVTQNHPGDSTLVYPLGRVEIGREGLFRQLNWAANELNFGYYAWRAGAVVSWSFADGALRLISPGLNAGTVGIQGYLAEVLTPDDWTRAVTPGGLESVYQELFGSPFLQAVDPLIEPGLVQPVLQLPFEPGKTWAFTGGPHGAWASGSAWAALDFAPPAEAEGCTVSNEWVVAAASGPIVRAENGAVLQDLDGDGFEGTGWVLFYMHIAERDRVAVGTFVNAGDRIGHPSCEGGFSNGTHVHFARKYNGEWIPADGGVPFTLDGWVSSGYGREYDGALTQGDISIEACDCRAAGNEIHRP